MKNEELVVRIIEQLGGKANVISVENCMTRLRVLLQDDSLAKEEKLRSLEGVMGTVHDRQNYIEIVLGPGRCRKCADLCVEMGLVGGCAGSAANSPKSGSAMTAGGDWKSNKEALRSGQKKNSARDLMKTFGEVFVPLIPGVIAAGLCSGFAMLISQLVPGCKDGGIWGMIYQLLSLINVSFMTYITAWAGYRAAEKFGATPILGGMLGMITSLEGINTLSQMLGMWNEEAPLNSILRMGRGGVLAVFLGVWCLAKVEKAVRKRMPDSLDIIFTPLLTLLICSIPYILLIMPAMGFVSTGLCWIVEQACMSGSAVVRLIVGYAVTALFLPLVAMGMHHGLVALYSVQLASQGYVTLYPSLAMAGAGQVGAAIALYFWAKKRKDDSLCSVIRGALPAGILGVGEPLIYGVTMPLGKPFITAGLGAGFGGAFVMLMQVASTTWGPSGVLGFFVMTGGPNGPVKTMIFYGIGLAISCIMGFLITKFTFRSKEEPEKRETEIRETEIRKEAEAGTKGKEVIAAPVGGKVVPLSQVKDQTFAEGILGWGCGIMPEEDAVYAPADGQILTVAETGHAIGLQTREGTDILLHIGIDTVKLKGQHFTLHAKEEDIVKQGDLLISFDRKAIEKEGYDTTIMVIMTERMQEEIDVAAKDRVNRGEKLICI